jgi:hypothetical protein
MKKLIEYLRKADFIDFDLLGLFWDKEGQKGIYLFSFVITYMKDKMEYEYHWSLFHFFRDIDGYNDWGFLKGEEA